VWPKETKEGERGKGILGGPVEGVELRRNLRLSGLLFPGQKQSAVSPGGKAARWPGTDVIPGTGISVTFDPDVAEGDGIVVAGEPEVTFGQGLAGVGCVGHELGDGADVGIEDDGAVEFDADA